MKVSLSSESVLPRGPWLKALWVMAMIAFAAAPVGARQDRLADLRAQDERLLRIAEPIMAANVRLCDRTMPELGVALQSTDQYPKGSPPPFLAPVAFAAVLPGSPAAQAGIERDDGLVAIGGQPVTKRSDLNDSPLRDSAFAALADLPAAAPVELIVAHAGQQHVVSLRPPQECRALAEILADNSNTSRSDGRTIQIAYGLARQADDSQLAAIFAHELAHAVLHHRDRLSSAEVKKGLLGEFGRDRRLNREAEIEADRLSVHLLANAGMDPRAAPALWRSQLGRKLSGGVFHDQQHPSAEARAKLLDEEIAQHLTAGTPSYPADLLAKRTQPLR